MKFKRLTGGTLSLLAAATLAWGCSDKGSDCNANLNCAPASAGDSGTSGQSGTGGATSTAGHSGTTGSSGSGGHSGGLGNTEAGSSGEAGSAGSTVVPPKCDASLTPDADACVISDDYGFFVSPSGDDTTGDGTEAHPYATVTKALSKIDQTTRVYVCAAVYDNEPDTLVIPDGAEIYGGFSCAGGKWAYDASSKANLISKSPVGATITGAHSGVTLQDVRIESLDAPNDGTGANSFGLVVNGSDHVQLTRVDVKAGKGGLGKAGENGATGLDGVASGPAQNGAAASCSTPLASHLGGLSADMICGSQGGNGGLGRTSPVYSTSQDGESAFLVDPSNGGKGGTVLGENGNDGTAGHNGARGSLGSAANPLGTFSTMGYAVASGGSGTAGKPGQGGGGGGGSLGSSSCVGASGGAGGMGGCGGDPGTGGVGGGASVALFSWNSTVNIAGGTFIASAGGAGGNGGIGHLGGSGVSGGTGGSRDATTTVGRGGNGGVGGGGGSGGNAAGGTGGPSIGLVYRGTKPTETNNPIFTPGLGGAAGIGAQIGTDTANKAPDGTIGLAQAEHAVLP